MKNTTHRDNIVQYISDSLAEMDNKNLEIWANKILYAKVSYKGSDEFVINWKE